MNKSYINYKNGVFDPYNYCSPPPFIEMPVPGQDSEQSC